ncbi:MAG: ribonuclease HI [Acidobacteriota bacterium]
MNNPKRTPDVEVLLYTDGACSRNPGPGGWAFILKHPASGKTLERSGAEPSTTNNRMELMAVIQGLRALKRPAKVHLVTDSEYVKRGLEEWMAGWKERGWQRRTSGGLEPVKNVDLWQELDRLLSRHVLSFEHVRGHAGHPENERCDALAVAAARSRSSGE